ncbi:MAG: YicC/YloC family endoribonuclease [Marinibacterium sp.]
MIVSMTGFAAARGAWNGFSWQWDLRSVNARGLDVRIRIPDWLDGLEQAIRKDISAAVSRGNVSVTLRLSRADEDGALRLNAQNLDAALAALVEVETRAESLGLALETARSSDILSLRGVWDTSTSDIDPAPLVAELKPGFAALLGDFLDVRRREGAALAKILSEQITRVDVLAGEAASLAETRKAAVADGLRTNLARVLDNSDGADPDRVAQELALIAVKTDVTEEIDRLSTHVNAARDLLAKGGAVGRKLDFLMQEFNREANTLCSKSQFQDLTAVGLELKAVIDQIREQVQNVE